jgi:hypothetical protein
MRPSTSIAAVTISLAAIASFSLLTTGCSSKPSKATVSAVGSDGSESTTVKSSSAADTIDAVEGQTSSSTGLEPAIAVGEPNAADPSATAATSSVDSAVSAEVVTPSTGSAELGPTELNDEQLTSAFTAMGIPVAADKLSCVKQKAGKTDMSAPEPPPEFLRALMSCVPKSLVEANGDKLSASATKSGVTPEAASCFQEKTFETMAAMDIAEFTKLLDANAPIDFPANVKATLKENTKDCALSDVQFASLLEG